MLAPVYFEQSARLLKVQNLKKKIVRKKIINLNKYQLFSVSLKTFSSMNLPITCHQTVEIKFTLMRRCCPTIVFFLKCLISYYIFLACHIWHISRQVCFAESVWQANKKLKVSWILFCHLHTRSQKVSFEHVYTYIVYTFLGASFAYERSSAMKINFMFSSFNWITASEMIFWKNHISFLCIPLFKLFIKHFVFFWNIIQDLK